MPRFVHLGAAVMAVAVFSVGCAGSGGTRAVLPTAPDSGGHGATTTRAVVVPTPTHPAPVPLPLRFFRMAPLRLVNDPPARFEYAYEAETVCLYGPANPDIDNDNDNDLVAPSKRGPVVAPQRDRVLTVGEFSLPTSCANPSPTPTPSPAPTGRLTRGGGRSLDAAVAKTKQYYVIRIDLADRSKTIAAGPASNVNDVLVFAAQAAPLTLAAGHRYVFALAYALVAVTPSPSPSSAPSDTPTPVPSQTPCPGAIDVPQGTYCSWPLPHPPVDLFGGAPYLVYSSSTGDVLGTFLSNHVTQESAVPGTPYALALGQFGGVTGVSGTFAGVAGSSTAFAVRPSNDPTLTFLAGPPSVPASPHDIASGGACPTGICSSETDMTIANGDVTFYNPDTQAVDGHLALTNPAASASLIIRGPNHDYDVLALMPDRHIVYAYIDLYGNLSEHVLDVLPAGYRFTGALRLGNGLHLTASDYQYGTAAQGHGFHELIDLASFSGRQIPFDASGGTCDAMGIGASYDNLSYYISCVNTVRQYDVTTDGQLASAPALADGTVMFYSSQPSGGQFTAVDEFFTSYQTSSIIELMNGVHYPGLATSAKHRATR